MKSKRNPKKPKWQKDDFFPIIGRIIKERYRAGGRIVRRDQIATYLLRDSEARQQDVNQVLESEAGNMVDWFSAYFTGHRNGDKRFVKWAWLLDQFEQSEVQGYKAYKPTTSDSAVVFPDEVPEDIVFREGAMRRVIVNAYERDPRARDECVSKYGKSCFICKFSFGSSYGNVAEGFIHVHHLQQLSGIRKEYVVDPIKDLRPVCPNCHAVLHLRNPAYSIEDVFGFLREARKP